MGPSFGYWQAQAKDYTEVVGKANVEKRGVRLVVTTVVEAERPYLGLCSGSFALDRAVVLKSASRDPLRCHATFVVVPGWSLPFPLFLPRVYWEVFPEATCDSTTH